MHDLLEARRAVGDRAAPTGVALDIRTDFPLLTESVHGKPLVWLDNAATTQKPRAVIERLVQFYERENANVHRAGHALGSRATDAFEQARDTVRRFINAPDRDGIVFVRGTTEAINLVAQTWGRLRVASGDQILVSALEHHSNLVPWQMLARDRGARLCVIPIDASGRLDLAALDALLAARTRVVAVTHVSNALGTVTPLGEIVRRAHRAGAAVVVDGAQAVAHVAVDVQELDVDFYAFSGHKVFGPTGIGVLFGKRARLDEAPPWQGGGSMIAEVGFETSTYRAAPYRFEAGTPAIADAVGLAAALEYVMSIGLDRIEAHDRALTRYATDALGTIPGLRQVGPAQERLGVTSFVVDDVEAGDIGSALDRDGIAVRVGHHCAVPALQALGVDAIVRASFAAYNTFGEVDALVSSLRRLVERTSTRKDSL
jgi:cysteine desulfurase/selenocysteine lyase